MEYSEEIKGIIEILEQVMKSVGEDEIKGGKYASLIYKRYEDGGIFLDRKPLYFN